MLLKRSSNRIHSYMMREAGASKLAVVKMVKELTGLGLKENSKDVVDECIKC
jgi:ribosomal protein L7/L12